MVQYVEDSRRVYKLEVCQRTQCCVNLVTLQNFTAFAGSQAQYNMSSLPSIKMHEQISCPRTYKYFVNNINYAKKNEHVFSGIMCCNHNCKSIASFSFSVFHLLLKSEQAD